MNEDELLRKYEQMTLEELLSCIKTIAQENYDGHFTVLHFTTNVRVGFRTPFERECIENVPAFKTLKDAFIHAIETTPTFY